MKLWLLTQKEVCGYDTYDSVVVAAMTEVQARQIHPYSALGFDIVWDDIEIGWVWDGDLHKDLPDCWPQTPTPVDATYLGAAKPGTEPGVICASFNAG